MYTLNAFNIWSYCYNIKSEFILMYLINNNNIFLVCGNPDNCRECRLFI